MDWGNFIQYGLTRWLHIMAGLMWVGMLFYFNFVQVQALAAANKDNTAAGIAKHVVPRALFWFRWSALVTWVAGAAMLGANIDDAMLFKERNYIPIGVGAWLGTIMLFNVWVLIWPSQKKVLGLAPATDAEKAVARRLVFLASRINLMLAFPMLFFMSASGGLFRTYMFL